MIFRVVMLILFFVWTIFGMFFYSGIAEVYRDLSEELNALLISLFFLYFKDLFNLPSWNYKKINPYRYIIKPSIYLWVAMMAYNVSDRLFNILVPENFIENMQYLMYGEIFANTPYLFFISIYLLIVKTVKGNTFLNNNIPL